MCNAIMETEKDIDYQVFLYAAKKISAAKKVCAFAVGSSCVSAAGLKMRLIKSGINVENSSDNHLQAAITANLGQHDVLILISVSSSTKDIIKLAEIAQKSGTLIIVIPNHSKSLLARFSYYLFINSKSEVPNEGGSLITVVSQLYIVDVLCTAIFGQLGVLSAIKTSEAVSDKLL